jgi:hypothetical protein
MFILQLCYIEFRSASLPISASFLGAVGSARNGLLNRVMADLRIEVQLSRNSPSVLCFIQLLHIGPTQGHVKIQVVWKCPSHNEASHMAKPSLKGEESHISLMKMRSRKGIDLIFITIIFLVYWGYTVPITKVLTMYHS